MAEQKQCRLDVATNWFEQCVADPNFLDRVITGSESWFFEYDPSDQQANKVYVKKGKPKLKTLCQSHSNSRAYSSFFSIKAGEFIMNSSDWHERLEGSMDIISIFWNGYIPKSQKSVV